jgi:hypothetical protein
LAADKLLSLASISSICWRSVFSFAIAAAEFSPLTLFAAFVFKKESTFCLEGLGGAAPGLVGVVVGLVGVVVGLVGVVGLVVVGLVGVVGLVVAGLVVAGLVVAGLVTAGLVVVGLVVVGLVVCVLVLPVLPNLGAPPRIVTRRLDTAIAPSLLNS